MKLSWSLFMIGLLSGVPGLVNRTLWTVGSSDEQEEVCVADTSHIVLEFQAYAYSPSGPGFAVQFTSGKLVLGLNWPCLGTVTILGFRQISMGDSMLKLRRPVGRLNFNMDLPIPVGLNPNSVTPPWCGFFS